MAKSRSQRKLTAILRADVVGYSRLMRRGMPVHAAWMWVLLGVFLLRVLAQFVQAVAPVRWLPPFDRWQGSSLAYPWLLFLQLLIATLFAWNARALSRNGLRQRRSLGAVLLIAGGIYFWGMAMRFGLGLTILSSHAWFGKPLPAFFHMVIASMVLLLGRHHFRSTSQTT